MSALCRGEGRAGILDYEGAVAEIVRGTQRGLDTHMQGIASQQQGLDGVP